MPTIDLDNKLIIVDGVTLPQPYSYQWSLQDVSAPNAGRTLDTIMHKDRVGQKRKIQLAWRAKDTTVTSQILQAFNPEYVTVRYFDLLDNEYQYREFYVGDRSAPVKIWNVGRHIIETITFDIIER